MIGLQPYRDIINPVPPIWKDISLDWYKSLLKEAEELTSPKLCETCKFWWLEQRPQQWPTVNYKTCRCPQNGSEDKYCETDDAGVQLAPSAPSESGKLFHGWHDPVTTPNPPEDGSYAFAGDYYPAEWITGPKFGCIHHEPKQQ